MNISISTLKQHANVFKSMNYLKLNHTLKIYLYGIYFTFTFDSPFLKSVIIMTSYYDVNKNKPLTKRCLK